MAAQPAQAEAEPSAEDLSAWIVESAIANVKRSKSGNERNAALRLLAEVHGLLRPGNSAKSPSATSKPVSELTDTEAAREIAFALARGVKELESLRGKVVEGPKPEPKPLPEPPKAKPFEEAVAEADERETAETGLQKWERDELAMAERREMKSLRDKRQMRTNAGHVRRRSRS